MSLILAVQDNLMLVDENSIAALQDTLKAISMDVKEIAKNSNPEPYTVQSLDLSRWNFVVSLLAALFGLFGAVFVIVGVVEFCISIYMVLKGAFSAAYTVDAEGMTTYWRKNTYRLLWTDCIEFEIVQVPINWGTSIAIVYCSTRVLSQKEKENFFWFHKNDFAHVQYFQYSDEAIFQEFLHCVPERARNYLEAKALVLGLPGE